MIRRVVTLVDNVSDLVTEADRRNQSMDHSAPGDTLTSSSDE